MDIRETWRWHNVTLLVVKDAIGVLFCCLLFFLSLVSPSSIASRTPKTTVTFYTSGETRNAQIFEPKIKGGRGFLPPLSTKNND
jgi:hypothetical protein